MTDRELKKLSRTDLIEMMLSLSRENLQLRAELEQVCQQLEDRTIRVRNAGSLAEASLALNGVFEAAQKAAEQYTLNIQQKCDERMKLCAIMEQQTREKCDRMLAEAQAKAGASAAQLVARPKPPVEQPDAQPRPAPESTQ